MAKKKWTVDIYKGQINFCYYRSSIKIEDLCGNNSQWPEPTDPNWETHDSDWTFRGALKFYSINRSSASGLQFIFTDLNEEFWYVMLPSSFQCAIKQATMGVLTGEFGFEKIGSSMGVVWLNN